MYDHGTDYRQGLVEVVNTHISWCFDEGRCARIQCMGPPTRNSSFEEASAYNLLVTPYSLESTGSDGRRTWYDVLL